MVEGPSILYRVVRLTAERTIYVDRRSAFVVPAGTAVEGEVITMYRQRIKAQSSSVESKDLRAFLAHRILCQSGAGMSREQALAVAADAVLYLQGQKGGADLGSINFSLIQGRDYNAKRNVDDQPEKMCRLQLIAADDVEVLREFGNVAMLTARMARVMEDACKQDAVFDGRRLALLFPLSLRALRERLKRLWGMGADLPLAGASRAYREQWRAARGVLAVQCYLTGVPLYHIRRNLVFSQHLWRQWWSAFLEVLDRQTEDVDVLMQDLVQPRCLVRGWLNLAQNLPSTGIVRERLEDAVTPASKCPEDLAGSDAFVRCLRETHQYSRSAAERLLADLDTLADQCGPGGRTDGQILYFGVCSSVPPARPLTEARLRPVYLDYLESGDRSLVDVQSPMKLRTQRIKRIVTGAYEQGAPLSVPDVAYVMGLSTDAVSRVLKQHKDVLLLTRGRVADTEPMLECAEDIVQMFFSGCTMMQIRQHTGRSRDLVERHLNHFARVASCVDKGMSPAEIGLALELSPRMVERCVSLYKSFRGPEFSAYRRKLRVMAGDEEDIISGEEDTKDIMFESSQFRE